MKVSIHRRGGREVELRVTLYNCRMYMGWVLGGGGRTCLPSVVIIGAVCDLCCLVIRDVELVLCRGNPDIFWGGHNTQHMLGSGAPKRCSCCETSEKWRWCGIYVERER